MLVTPIVAFCFSLKRSTFISPIHVCDSDAASNYLRNFRVSINSRQKSEEIALYYLRYSTTAVAADVRKSPRGLSVKLGIISLFNKYCTCFIFCINHSVIFFIIIAALIVLFYEAISKLLKIVKAPSLRSYMTIRWCCQLFQLLLTRYAIILSYVFLQLFQPGFFCILWGRRHKNCGIFWKSNYCR